MLNFKTSPLAFMSLSLLPFPCRGKLAAHLNEQRDFPCTVSPPFFHLLVFGLALHSTLRSCISPIHHNTCHLGYAVLLCYWTHCAFVFLLLPSPLSFSQKSTAYLSLYVYNFALLDLWACHIFLTRIPLSFSVHLAISSGSNTGSSTVRQPSRPSSMLVCP